MRKLYYDYTICENLIKNNLEINVNGLNLNRKKSIAIDIVKIK